MDAALDWLSHARLRLHRALRQLCLSAFAETDRRCANDCGLHLMTRSAFFGFLTVGVMLAVWVNSVLDRPEPRWPRERYWPFGD